MRFSQMIKKTEKKVELEKDGMNDNLRNTLWSIFLTSTYESLESITKFYRSLWLDFFKIPIDDIRIDEYGGFYEQEAKSKVRKWFFNSEWYEAFDFIEFSVNFQDNKFAGYYNAYLKREMSAYRFVDGKIAELNSEEELIEVQKAISKTDKFNSVKSHLKRAVELYADKKNPDFRNSMKESISAVESLSRIIAQNDKITLGKALKIIEAKNHIPNSLKKAFEILYGYTSNEGGIRHSLLENGKKVNLEEARFMLVTCSAFVNYLISKL